VTDLQHRLMRLVNMRPDVFGAEGHDFELNPPLAEAKVEELERRHGIRLPADYRAFITTIANGGAGPGCGLFTFLQWYEEWVEKSLRGE